MANNLWNRECSYCMYTVFLRANCKDDLAGEKSHCYGPSTGNQSLHCRLSWWINFFKDIMDPGVFLTSDVLLGEYIWFCFAELIQHDLDFVNFHWNKLCIQH